VIYYSFSLYILSKDTSERSEERKDDQTLLCVATYSEQNIDCSSHRIVRHIFTEFSAWSEWNPLYEYVRVVRSNSVAIEQQPNDVGTALETAVRFYPAPVRCTITESTPNVISWTSHISCLVPARNTVKNTFTVVNDGTTTYNREEQAVGLLCGLEYIAL